MEITLIQGIGLALMALVVGIDFWLEGFFLFRPIIVGTLTGLILGDLQLGLVAGGITELAFAGLTPAGGTQPPNPVLAGVMTTVLAYTTGTAPAGAMALALPFSFLMQYVILFCYSSFSFFMKGADEAAECGDTKKSCRLIFAVRLLWHYSMQLSSSYVHMWLKTR
ncbi:MAG: PTS sugar transporter subunit IIC [Chitinophagaceae bacterium]